MTNKISPLVIVIFGATGDLTRKKLMPALFKMYREGLLGEKFYVVGVARRDLGREKFVEMMGESVISQSQSKSVPAKGGVGQNDSEVSSQWEKFKDHIYYQQGYFEEEEPYRKLATFLTDLEGNGETVTKPFARGPLKNAALMRYFYLATPPDQYEVILNHLHETKLSEGCGQGSDKWTKVLIEKPFGRSLSDAKALDAKLARLFKEEQIYRIDHYLAKEAVQNILAFRYGNSIFEPVWNKDFIDHVQISIAETLGVETRGNFYEGVGALRDMAQSHLLELMAAVAMKEPSRYDADGIRKERARIIAKVSCIQPEEVSRFTVRGQYGKGPAHRSLVEIPSYREEPNV
ncbi:MAG: glucose-6-phosphate dehydrogenase (NADP(+)), partial [Candidatus Levybacteria bacterium]|nr:glucose-6-phosphate dehydrogenase (NADP(+)) [Candidatus Levybacteria bacterium]